LENGAWRRAEGTPTPGQGQDETGRRPPEYFELHGYTPMSQMGTAWGTWVEVWSHLDEGAPFPYVVTISARGQTQGEVCVSDLPTLMQLMATLSAWIDGEILTAREAERFETDDSALKYAQTQLRQGWNHPPRIGKE
jgi:hypothetical protein